MFYLQLPKCLLKSQTRIEGAVR